MSVVPHLAIMLSQPRRDKVMSKRYPQEEEESGPGPAKKKTPSAPQPIRVSAIGYFPKEFWLDDDTMKIRFFSSIDYVRKSALGIPLAEIGMKSLFRVADHCSTMKFAC